jgi:aminoglycoside phosphotransferase (APT) family kinase protein
VRIPNSLSDIDEVWLSDVLQAQVTSVEVVDEHSGTTGRGVLRLSYAQQSNLPARLFVKLPPVDELQKAFVISSGMGRREVLFYQHLGGDVPIRTPRCYYCAASESGDQYIMLLEHLEDTDCTFRNSSTLYSLDFIRSVLDSFAALHAHYWQSPRLETDLAWLQPPVQHAIGVDLVASALEQFGSEMPGVFTSMAELYLANTDAIHRLWNDGDCTLVHGDVHDGNLFFDDAQPGFLDWALTARAPGMRDVGYFIAGAMKPEDRGAHQRAMLQYYRARLIQYGAPAPSEAQLWEQYQWHAAYVWIGAVTTLAMGDAWQPIRYSRKSLDRINATLDDLNSVQGIRANLARV